MKFDGTEGLYQARLSTVVDCGDLKDGPSVFLSFQLEDCVVDPLDKTLTNYCQFCKLPYGGIVTIREGSKGRVKYLDPILEVLGYRDGDVIDFLIRNAGAFFNLKVDDNLHRGNHIPVVAKGGHSLSQDNGVDYGVDVKTFRWAEDTTMEDLDELGFDKKVVKKSKQYQDLRDKNITQDDIDEVF